MTLLDRLMHCSRLWAEANERSLARLATVVMNDGNFFVRLESPSATTTAATLEKFARFFGEAGNWPDDHVPPAVCEFAQVVGISSAACEASPDSLAANITLERGEPAEPEEGCVCPPPSPGRGSVGGACPAAPADHSTVAADAGARVGS